jgi:hypothetical protein
MADGIRSKIEGEWNVTTLSVATLRRIVRDLDKHDIADKHIVFLEDGGGKAVFVGKIRVTVDQGPPPVTVAMRPERTAPF